MQPICEKYANKVLFIRGGKELSKSCDQLREIVDRFSLQMTTFSQFRESVKSSAGLNIFEAKVSDFPKGYKCLINKSPGVPTITCNLVMFNAPVTLIWLGGSTGFIEKVTLKMDDAFQMMKPMIEGIDYKKDTQSLPSSTDFYLDVLVAKNNAIAPSEETYRRTKRGLEVSILNIYPR